MSARQLLSLTNFNIKLLNLSVCFVGLPPRAFDRDFCEAHLPRSRSPRYQAANSASRSARCPLVNIANSRSVPPASKTFLKVNRYGTSLRPPRGFGIAASTFFGTGTGTVEPARATAQKRPMRSSRPALSLSRGRDEAGRPTSLRPTDCTPRKNAKIRVDWDLSPLCRYNWTSWSAARFSAALKALAG